MPSLSPMNHVDLLLESVAPSKRLKSCGSYKPHKVILLLASLDLVRCTPMWDGILKPDARLEQRFRLYFSLVQGSTDRVQMANPFIHLRNSEFWELVPRPGVELESLSKLRTGFTSVLHKSVSHAVISSPMFEIWSNEATNLDCSLRLMQVLKEEINRT